MTETQKTGGDQKRPSFLASKKKGAGAHESMENFRFLRGGGCKENADIAKAGINGWPRSHTRKRDDNGWGSYTRKISLGPA